MKTKTFTCRKCLKTIKRKYAVCEFCQFDNIKTPTICEFCHVSNFKVPVELLPCLHVVHKKCFKKDTQLCPIVTCLNADLVRTVVLNNYEEKLIDYCEQGDVAKICEKFDTYFDKGRISVLTLFNTFLTMKRDNFEPLIHHILKKNHFNLASISTIKEAHKHYCWLQSLPSIAPHITSLKIKTVPSNFSFQS